MKVARGRYGVRRSLFCFVFKVGLITLSLYTGRADLVEIKTTDDVGRKETVVGTIPLGSREGM